METFITLHLSSITHKILINTSDISMVTNSTRTDRNAKIYFRSDPANPVHVMETVEQVSKQIKQAYGQE